MLRLAWCALQVTQSLVDHLNTNLKAAIDKADDAEAEAVQVKQQVGTGVAGVWDWASLRAVWPGWKVRIVETKISG